MRKTVLIIVFGVLLIGVSLFGFSKKALGPQNDAQNPTPITPVKTDPQFDKTTYSTTDPTSQWVVVNKQHPLSPTSYVPADLVVPDVALRLGRTQEQMQIRKVVEQPIKDMFKDASTAGFSLSFGSGYRSFALQKQFYNGYVAQDGQASADRLSARPGYSEHQSGLAFDVEITGGKCHLEACLGVTPDGKWIAANAHKYGFIIRYPEGKEAVTGYDYEPWHLRFIGVELATELKNKNIQTLEEFFNIPGGQNY